MLGSRPQVRNRSAAHSAEWQDLELIFRQLLQHRIMRESREGSSVCITYCRSAETFRHACLRPTEAACICVQKCANNHQLIVAGVQGFYDTHAQLTSVSSKHAKRHVHYIYIRKH